MNSIKTFTYIYHLHIYIFLNTFITTYLLKLNLYGITKGSRTCQEVRNIYICNTSTYQKDISHQIGIMCI